MAKKSANATTAAQKLKKGAKKLLGTAKKSGKLAAALPLAALVVEEARAAQMGILPNFDLAGLDPFAQPEQSQELVLEDVTQEELAKAADEEVQELLAELDSESRSDDLLLAQADTNDRAAGYIASDAGGAGASASTASTAEAAVEGFELSGLPAAAVAAGPAGVFAAVATAAVVSVNNDGGTTPETRNDVDVSGSTTLSTSLETLQANGVDAVNSTENTLHLKVDNVASLSATAAFPLFGDRNKDGVLSAAEDDALDVVLDITSQAQLDQLMGFGGLNNLAAAGIDHLHLAGGVRITDAQVEAMSAAGLAFLDRDNVTLLSSGEPPAVAEAFGTKLGHEVSNLAAMGVDKIDMQGAGSVFITETQAAALKAEGITFADDDFVTVVAQEESSISVSNIQAWDALGVDRIDMGNHSAAFLGSVHLNQDQVDALTAANIGFAANDDVSVISEGTQLSSTLVSSAAALKAMGVDHIDIAGVPTSASIGGLVHLNVAEVEALSAAGLDFASNDHVIFDAATGTQLTGHTAQLQSLGVDHVNIHLDSQAALEHLGQTSSLSDLHGATATIHMGSNAELFESSVAQMAAANVNFAATSHDVQAFVQLDAAHGTHMASTLADLHKVGVEHVFVQGSGSPNDNFSFNVDLGSGVDVGSLNTVFNSVDHVTVNVTTQAEKDAFTDELKGRLHIDEVRIVSTGANFVGAEAPGAELLEVLSNTFDMTALSIPAQAPVVIADDLGATLHASGMSATLPGETVLIDAGSTATLQTSLKAMGEMGVDGVASDAGKVYVELGDDVNVATLVDTFGSAHDLFEQGQDASLVLGEATFGAMSEAEISNLIATISDLGFTEVSVLNAQGGNAYAIDNVAQTLVTTQVEILGADQAQALLDVFGTDILNNKNA